MLKIKYVVYQVTEHNDSGNSLLKEIDRFDKEVLAVQYLSEALVAYDVSTKEATDIGRMQCVMNSNKVYAKSHMTEYLERVQKLTIAKQEFRKKYGFEPYTNDEFQIHKTFVYCN